MKKIFLIAFLFQAINSFSQESYYAHIVADTVHCVEVVTDEFVKANPKRYSGTWKKVGTEAQPFVGKGYIYRKEEDIITPK